MPEPRDSSIPPLPRLPDPVRLHVDVPLHLAGQFGAVPRQELPQIAGEDMQLLEVRVREGQDLRQERVEARVLPQPTAEL